MSDADFAQRATDLISNLQALDPTAAADMAATMEAALGTAVAGAVTSHGSRVMSEDASASSSSPINP